MLLLSTLISLTLQVSGTESFVSPAEKPTKISADLKFTEGPVWTRRKTLVFSDIPANRIYEWDGSSTKVLVEPSRNANGNIIDKMDLRYAAEHGSRSITVTAKDGSVKTLAYQFEGKRLNSPNDLIIHRTGAIFFTDPPYGVAAKDVEQAKNNVLRLAKDGKVTLVDASMNRPNGITLSPDEKKLFYCDSATGAVHAVSLDKEGLPGTPEKIATVSGPDGMRVDRAGNLWLACRNGVVILTATGTELGVIPFPEVPANLCFGEDGATLFVTARTSVYRLRLKVKGIMPGW